MITRRGLLSGIFSAGIAPWVVKAGVLMPVKKIVLPEFQYGRIAQIKQEMIRYGQIYLSHEPIPNEFQMAGWK